MTAQILEAPNADVSVFTASAPDSIDPTAVEAAVKKNAYAIVRGLFDRDELRRCCDAAKRRFSPCDDAPGVGTPADAAMKNFQKLVIGGGAQRGYYVPRFTRIFYNPIWTDDIFGMRDVFRRLAQLRNVMQGYPLNFAIDGVEDGLFTAARMQHYPAGGGFFGAHLDAVVDKITAEAGLSKFIQLVLLMTQKGDDFEQGGAFVTSGQTRLDLESVAQIGDVLVYDGRSEHGVDDIDPHLVPSLTELQGRIVALASLYKDLDGKAAQYSAFLQRTDYED